eukprot:m.176232 g.176232  ORF g.176232 m.176232 type:complete len:67 (+) comp16558_c2_seq1:121-321(+)
MHLQDVIKGTDRLILVHEYILATAAWTSQEQELSASRAWPSPMPIATSCVTLPNSSSDCSSRGALA